MEVPLSAAASAPPTSAPISVLFLDFDGVLQTPALDDWKNMELCGELLALLVEMPELQLVVSSSHREGRDLEGVRRLLPAAAASRVVGLTPVSPRCRARGGRQAEIEQWLSAHPQVARHAAIDDEAHLFDSSCPWLVLTSPYVGWDEAATQRLRGLLSPSAVTQPTMTGIRKAPKISSASHLCLPSTKVSPAPLRASTGNAGQSTRAPADADVNQVIWNCRRRTSGKSAASHRASFVSSLASIWRTWTGERTKS